MYQEKRLEVTAAAAGAALGCLEAEEHASARQNAYWRLTLANLAPVALASAVLAGMVFILV